MKSFMIALKEINSTLNYLLFFDVFINSVIVFLASYLIFLLLKITPLHAIEVTLFYLGVSIYLKKKKRKTLEVEKRYSFLNEKLRTAEDNIYYQSPVADDLQREILQDLKRVESSSFFNPKNLFIKSGVIIMLCFLVLNFHPIQFKSLKFTLPELKSGINLDFTGTNFAGTKLASSGKKQQANVQMVELNDNIYGDSSVAVLGGEEMIIQLKSINQEIKIRDQDEMEEEEDELFPEVGTRSAEAFQENIPKEQQELVKNYFKSVVEG